MRILLAYPQARMDHPARPSGVSVAACDATARCAVVRGLRHHHPRKVTQLPSDDDPT